MLYAVEWMGRRTDGPTTTLTGSACQQNKTYVLNIGCYRTVSGNDIENVFLSVNNKLRNLLYFNITFESVISNMTEVCHVGWLVLRFCG